MDTMRKAYVMVLMAAVTLSASAQLQFTLEEDYFAGTLNRDANYTGGFYVSVPRVGIIKFRMLDWMEGIGSRGCRRIYVERRVL